MWGKYLNFWRRRRKPGVAQEPPASGLRLESLESRVLFSADLPWAETGVSEPETLDQSYEQSLAPLVTTGLPAAQTAQADRQNLVVIDPSLLSQLQVSTSLVQEQYEAAGFDVALLHDTEDGLSQLNALVSSSSGIDSVEVLSTAQADGISLGGDTVGINEVLNNNALISGWSNQLFSESAFNVQAVGLDQFVGAGHMAELLTTLTGVNVEFSAFVGLGPEAGLQIEQQARHEVVFVDTGVEGYQALVDDIRAAGGTDRTLEVILLDEDRDGVDQISEILRGFDNLDAIHIVAHGTDGTVQLGASTLSNSTLDVYNTALLGWQSALSDEADLLIYGCDLASSEVGEELVRQMAALTGADVAASDDLTGALELGGDWDLEFADGAIEAQLAFSESLQDSWDHVLATNLSSGIELNTNGGNDAYLISNTGLATALNAATFEILFSAQNLPNETVFLSFNNAAGDEYSIQIDNPNGDLELDFGSGSPSYSTAIDYQATLLDGELHSLAVSWDSSNGDWAVYIDGEFVDSGSGVNAGNPLDTTNGQFVFGQEQDGLNAGYSVDQYFSGTIYDIRIWDEVRSGAEIALNYQNKFDVGSLPDGLVANWQMDGFDGSGQVVDVVSGNNLSKANVLDAPTVSITDWTNQVGGVTASSNTLTFVDDGAPIGWNSSITSGLFSALGFYDDYKVSFEVPQLEAAGSATGLQTYTIGLSTTETDSTQGDVEYAMYFDSSILGGGAVRVQVLGVETDYLLGYSDGDTFAFEIDGTDLHFQHNGVTFHTESGLTGAEDWYIDTSWYANSSGAYSDQADYSISNVRINGNLSFSAGMSVEGLHVGENSINGTRVGFVVPSDPENPNDLLVDGRFLEVSPAPVVETLYSAGDSFGGWTVTNGSVDLEPLSLLATPHGGQSVDLSGDQAGTLESDSFATVVGQTYQVTFALDGNYSGGDLDSKGVRVSAAGVSQDFVVDRVGGGWHNEHWEYRSFTFTANASSTSLAFESLDASAYGAFLADVSVVEVPTAIPTILGGDATLSYDTATDKFYRFVNSSVDFDTALAAATSDLVNGVPGQLVTIRSAYENALVQQFAIDSGEQIWLGAQDSNDDGNWNWLQGSTESSEQFWAGGSGGSATSGSFAPSFSQSNVAGEDYARLANTGDWFDQDAGVPHAYVVEWDASEVLSSFTFELLDDAGGRFAINNSSGEITVADGSLLDYELSAFHTIDVEVTDAAGNSYFEETSITIDNGIDPTHFIPGTQFVAEDALLTFSSSNGNAVTVTDTLTSADTLLQVSLSVNDGDLTLSQLLGITIVDGANNSSSIVFNGTKSAINAALEGMTFDSHDNFYGSVSLLMTTSTAAALEGLYRFDDGTANDTSVGTNNDGTLYGDAATVAYATRGDVLNLDGAGDYVRIPGLLSEPANITLAAWINPIDTDTLGSVVVSMGTSPALYLEADGRLTGHYESGGTAYTVTTQESFVATGWRHIALSIDTDSDELTLYVDGQAAEVLAVNAPIEYDNSPDTYIGRWGNGAAGFDFAGMIDDARIYSRALSGSEIAALSAGNTTDSDTLAITVTPVNDLPALDLDADDSAVSGLDFAATWTEGSGPVAIVDTDAVVDNVDSDNLSSLTITLTNVLDGVAELLSADTSGTSIVASYDSNTGVLLLSGSDSTANYQQVLRTVTYNNVHTSPYSPDRIIEFVAHDGADVSPLATTTLSLVTDVNVLVVTNVSDVVNGDITDVDSLLSSSGGDGISLREALLAMNNTANTANGPDVIRFDVAGAGPHIINLTTTLPTITDAVVIDGMSEPDYGGTPMVVLNGAGAGSASGLTFGVGSGGSSVSGLVINEFSNNGIRVLAGSDGNTFVGNYIGLDVTGTLDRGNGNVGISVSSASNIIGGANLADRNVISGNGSIGVRLAGSGASNNQILGNFIGTNALGTSSIGNVNSGVRIDGGASNNIVGGTDATQRNVISGNANDGIYVTDSGTSSNQILGNFIGTDASGVLALGNADRGIQIESNASNTFVGGASLGAGNVISSNGNDGVILSSSSNNTVVQGNFIGTDQTGTLDLGNGAWGVRFGPSSGNLIGGTVAGAGNTIAFNSVSGIRNADGSAVNNSFLGNAIYANNDIGIDLNVSGVTANDNDDLDSGPNNQQNYPVLTSVSTNGVDQLVVSGAIDSTANATFRLEFFASASADSTGHGEAERYLGFVLVTTDASGDLGFNAQLSALVANGESVTATATVVDDLGQVGVDDRLAYGDSSEFSQNRTAVLSNAPILDLDDNDSAASGSGFVSSWTEGGGPVAITDTDAVVIDLDSATLTELRVTISNHLDGIAELLGADTTGTSIIATYDDGAGVLTLAGSDSVANYQQVLRTITYNNTSQDADTASRVISFQANDGVSLGTVVQTTVTMAVFNDAPTIVNNTLTISEGASVILSATELSAQDPDNSAGTLNFTVSSVVGGQFEAVSNPGVAITNFSQQQITDSEIRFVHDAGEAAPAYDVRVDDGVLSTVGAAATIDFTNVNDAPSGTVTIDNLSPSQGDLLTASNSLSDADGLSGSIGYQWYRDGVAISGATGATYSTTQADVDAVVTVLASYTDDQGTAESVSSVATAAVLNVNDPVSGQPVILGTQTENQTLTTDTTALSDEDGLGVFSFQWYRDGVAVSGATASSYLLGDVDVGAILTVAVSYVDDYGAAESSTSIATGAIVNVNDAPTGAVVINNLNPAEGDTLTVSNTLADADGLSGSISYQWYRDGALITGATGSSYTTVQADVDGVVTVSASYTDDQGTPESVLSGATAAVTNVNDPVSGQPVIFGTATQGQTLTVDTTGISDNDGLGAFGYQWYRDGVAISGATSGTYTALQADVGGVISVVASYTDDQGTAESVASAATAAVANVNDAVSGQPVILGTTTEDQTLTIDTSAISDADGLGAFTYQWYRDGVAVAGASADSYVLDDADVGANLSVAVSYVDGYGAAESTTSSAVGLIANINDAPVGAVVIDNLAPAQGEVLTANNTLADADGLSGPISYQWYRDGVAISGAAGATYTTVQADVGSAITALASFTDDQGTLESALSPATAAVTNVNDVVSGQPVILGTPAEDQILNTDISGISDADGLGAFSYQWFRDGIAIGGETTGSLTLGDVDVGTHISVEVSYTDGYGVVESTTSAAVGPIANVNDIPVVTPGLVFGVTENSSDGTLVGQVTASDIDALLMLDDWTIVSGNDGGAFSIDSSTGEIRVADFNALDFESTPAFWLGVTVSDGFAVSAVANVRVNLTDLNEAPVLVDDQLVTNEDTAFIINTAQLLSNDSDPEASPLMLVSITQPVNGFVVDQLDGTWRYQPNTDFHGTERISYTVTDGVNQATAELQIVVAPVNDSPQVLTPNLINLQEDVSSVVDFAVLDVDGDLVTFTVTGGPDASAFEIDNTSGALRFVETPDFEQPADANQDNIYELSVTVDDANGGQAEHVLQVDVANVNETPLLDSATIPVVADVDGLRLGQLNAVDPDTGDTLVYEITSGDPDQLFQLDAANGELYRTDDGTPIGVYQLNVRVTDAAGLSSTAVVEVVVGKSIPNQVPVLDDPTEMTGPGEPQSETPEGTETTAQEPTQNNQPATQEPSQSEEPTATEFVRDNQGLTQSLVGEDGFVQPNSNALNFTPAELPVIERFNVDRPSTQQAQQVWLNLNFVTERSDTRGLIALGALADQFSSLSLPISMELANALDALAETALSQDEEVDLRVSGAVAGSLSLSAGFVVWMLRGGSLMASLLSSKPMWTEFDPLPVFADDEPEEDADRPFQN